MIDTPRRFFRSYPGGAGHALALAGADSALDELGPALGYAGVSAGALIAIARAFGIGHARLQAVLERLLQQDRLLDIAPLRLGDAGLCAWDVVPRTIDELLGRGVTMGEARVPLIVVVTDLDSGAPRYLSSQHTPRVLVSEAARATSAFPGIAPQLTIPSLGTAMSPDIRLHTDGGVTDNTADHVWDDRVAPRVALRLVGSEPLRRVRHGEPIAQALALFNALTFAPSTLKSRRLDGVVIDVPRVGDGLDFSLSTDEMRARWRAGHAAVMARAADVRASVGAA